MSENHNGQKHDDLGRLADIVADVCADEPSEAQWERARHNLTSRLESHRLEALAEASATLCLQSFPPVTAVRLEIRKPRAVEAADASFVRIERGRS